MKVLLTGGLGYIGSHTALELLKQNNEVEILDNLYNSQEIVKDKIEQISGKKIKFYKIDLCDKLAVDTLFSIVKYDAVIHFAGYKAVGESVAKPLMYYENNLMSTVNLLNAMINNGVKNLVFSSSACVYAQSEKSPLTEESAVCPGNPYGRTKYFIEEILKDTSVAHPELNITILRYFNPVGAHESGLLGEDPNGLPNNLMPYVSRVSVGKLPQVNVFGNDYPTPDGTGIRDYIHIEDLANGHALSLNHMKNGVHIYNLGTGKGSSVLEVINTYNEVCGGKVKYAIAPRRPGDSAICYAKCDKANKELNFKAQKTLKDACASTYKFELLNLKK